MATGIPVTVSVASSARKSTGRPASADRARCTTSGKSLGSAMCCAGSRLWTSGGAKKPYTGGGDEICHSSVCPFHGSGSASRGFNRRSEERRVGKEGRWRGAQDERKEE